MLTWGPPILPSPVSSLTSHKRKKVYSPVGISPSFHLQKTNWLQPIRAGNNWGIINFQKEKIRNSENLRFTINAGVSSTSLRSFFEHEMNIWECHWRIRVGNMLVPERDIWWTVDGMTNVEVVANHITGLLADTILPAIREHITDDQLEAYWLGNRASGLTEYQRLEYLTTLLKIYHKDNLDEIVGQLLAFSKGKGIENSARVHIKQLAELK